MKAVKLVLLIISMLPFVGAFAATPEQAYLETCRKDPAVPVPIAVVSPSVGEQYQGASVHLEFVVDTQGRPSAFTVKDAPDDILAAKVLAAVKLWRFQPAEVDGKPVAMKVGLPVRIVDPDTAEPRLVARN